MNLKPEKKDRARVVFPPPLMFFILLGAAVGLEYGWSLRPQGWPWLPRIIVGGVFLVAAGFLALSSFIVLIRNKTPFDPARPTLKIVKSGPFRLSRNPMYLSLLLSMAAGAILVCSVWFWIVVPILWLFLDYGAIRPEENYLIDKFGDSYRNYMQEVRRWL